MTQPNFTPQNPQDSQNPYSQPNPQFDPNDQNSSSQSAYTGPSNPFMRNVADDPFFAWNPVNLAARFLKGLRRGLIALGIIFTLLGVALLVWPGKSLMVATSLLAVAFLIQGVSAVAGAFSAKGTPSSWRVMTGLVGFFSILAAATMLRNLAGSTGFLIWFTGIFVGISWIMTGIAQIIESAGFLGNGWTIFAGIISILGGLALLFWPITSTATLILLLAITVLIDGIILLVRGLMMPKA